METKSAGPADRPFTTSNVILAFCLYLTGVPLLDENKPVLNFYDNDILKRLGFAGMTLEEGARAALQAGKKGHTEYVFQWPEELKSLLDAFNAEQKEVANAEGTVTAEASIILKSFAAEEMDEKETLMRLGCLILKSRGQFFNMWKGREDLALIRVPNAGKAVTREGTARNAAGKVVPAKVVTSPGYRVISLSASDKTKGELRV